MINSISLRLTKMIDEIIEALKQDIWTPLVVQAVITSKEEKRKDNTIQIYVLDVSVVGSVRPNETVIRQFVDEVFDFTTERGHPQRFELALKTSKVHWTAVDLVVTPKYGIKMLNIDASGDVSGVNACSVIFKVFKDKYTTQDAQHSEFFFLKHDDIPGTDKQRQIQYDKISCSRFTLDILFHLTQLDSFSLLESKKTDFSWSASRPDEYKFSITNMPTEMASILRNMQSKTAFYSLPDRFKNHIINKKGESLVASEQRHTEVIEIEGEKKAVNCAIEHKRRGFVEDTVSYLTSTPDATFQVEVRNVLVALDRRQFAPSIHLSSTVGSLFNEAQLLHKDNKEKKPLLLLIKNIKNTTIIKKASQELKQGHYQEALTTLEHMRAKTAEYKKEIQKTRDVIIESNNEVSFSKI